MASDLPEQPCDPKAMHGRLTDFVEEAKSESDRGIVLSGHALIEQNLRILLWQFMRGLPKPNYNHDMRKSFKNSLFGAHGIVSSHSACSKICFSLGVIDEVLYSELESLRTVRNRAAHDLKFRFDSEKVQEILEKYVDSDEELPNSIQFITTEFEESEAPEQERIVSVALRGDYHIAPSNQCEQLTISGSSINKQKIAYLSLVYNICHELPRLALKPSITLTNAAEIREPSNQDA